MISDQAVTYIVVRSDGKDSVFGSLQSAKDWLRLSGMAGTIHCLGAQPVARCAPTHWCAGCDGLVGGDLMAWTDAGQWRCAGCRRDATLRDWGRSVELV